MKALVRYLHAIAREVRLTEARVGRPASTTLLPPARCATSSGRSSLYDGLPHHLARGMFRSDAEGRVCLRSIVPTAYPIPTDGPVGRLLLPPADIRGSRRTCTS